MKTKKKDQLCVSCTENDTSNPQLSGVYRLYLVLLAAIQKNNNNNNDDTITSRAKWEKKKSSVSTPDAEIYLQLLHTPEKHGCAATLHRLGDICPTCMATPSWSFWLRFKLCLLSASPRKRRLASRRWPSPRSPHQHGG